MLTHCAFETYTNNRYCLERGVLTFKDQPLNVRHRTRVPARPVVTTHDERMYLLRNELIRFRKVNRFGHELYLGTYFFVLWDAYMI